MVPPLVVLLVVEPLDEDVWPTGSSSSSAGAGEPDDEEDEDEDEDEEDAPASAGTSDVHVVAHFDARHA